MLIAFNFYCVCKIFFVDQTELLDNRVMLCSIDLSKAPIAAYYWKLKMNKHGTFYLM